MSGELSDDHYRYLWDGALVRAGENPYLKLPVEVAASAPFQSEQRREWFANMNSPNYHSIYPPISQYVFALAGQAGYWGLKILFALAELGALLLLARLLNARQLILYAWNPLLLLETWGQPHSEALAILFLVVALWAWTKRRSAVIATGAIVVAGWVKLFPLLLLPVLWRHMDKRHRLRSVATAGVLSVAVWWPFLSFETFQNISESSHLYMLSFEFNAGPYYAIKWLTTMPLRAIGWLGENQDTSKVVGPLMRVLLVAGLLSLWRMDRSGRRDFGSTTAAVIGLFLVTFVNLHPWYLTFAVLGLPWMSPRWVSAWMWLCACSIATYLSYSHALYWPFVIAGWAGFAVVVLLFRPRSWAQLPG